MVLPQDFIDFRVQQILLGLRLLFRLLRSHLLDRFLDFVIWGTVLLAAALPALFQDLAALVEHKINSLQKDGELGGVDHELSLPAKYSRYCSTIAYQIRQFLSICQTISGNSFNWLVLFSWYIRAICHAQSSKESNRASHLTGSVL